MQDSNSSTSVSLIPDPWTPPSNGRCFFLALPAELRLQIYEYALSEEEGLMAQPPDVFKIKFKFHAIRKGKPQDREANQLQYVSRQLHAETKGMVLCLNDITFKGDITMTYDCDDSSDGFTLVNTIHGTTIFENFLQQYPPALHHRLQKIVVLYEGFPFPKHDSRPSALADMLIALESSSFLLRACSQNPRMTVLVRFPPRTSPLELESAWNWIGLHYGLHRILRAGEPFVETSAYFKGWWEAWIMSAPEDIARIHLPPNLRSTLAEDFPLTRQKVEEECSRFKPVSEDNVDEILAVARKIYDEGI